MPGAIAPPAGREGAAQPVSASRQAASGRSCLQGGGDALTVWRLTTLAVRVELPAYANSQNN